MYACLSEAVCDVTTVPSHMVEERDTIDENKREIGSTMSQKQCSKQLKGRRLFSPR